MGRFLKLLVFGLSNLVNAEGDVHVLTADKFDKFIQENPITLVKFFAPWCGHCKRLAPEFEQAATELKKINISLAEVDADIEKDLAQRFSIQGFPTLLLFRDGKSEPYNGGRTASTIVDWIKKMTGPAVEWKDNHKEAKETGADESVRFIAGLGSKDASEAKLYDAIARSHRTKGLFIAYKTNDEAEINKVAAHRQGEEAIVAKIESESQLKEFVEQESVPLFGPINGENYAAYAQRSKSWVWFAGGKSDFTKVAPEIRKVSNDYRDEFNFVWLDTETHQQHAEHMLGLTDLPNIAVVYDESKYHYQGKPLEVKHSELSKFIATVKNGKIKPFLKSEPIPESNDEPVKVVVGRTFSKMVLQPDKDVFLEIYAPWCGHCKKLAPIYEELATRLAENSHLVVAKCDGTANEPDVKGFEYRGFPTLYFVKAGTKTPISYDGDRTIDAMLEFIKKHSSKPITVADSANQLDEEDKDEL